MASRETAVGRASTPSGAPRASARLWSLGLTGRPIPRPAFRTPQSPTGFTLLELVIALSLMAFLVGGLTMSLGNGLNAWDHGKSQAARAQEVRVAMDTLARDLRNAVIDPARMTEERELTWFRAADSGETNGDLDELTFTTNSRPLELYLGFNPLQEELAPTSDLCEVQYWVETDTEQELFGLLRREQSPPDDDPEDGGSVQVLSEWVTSLNLRFHDGEEFVDEWETSFEERQLPLAVEVYCTFEPVAADKPVVPLTYRTVVPVLRAEKPEEEEEAA